MDKPPKKPPSLCPLCQTTELGYNYQHPRVTVKAVVRDPATVQIDLAVDWGTWTWHRVLRPASLLEVAHPHERLIDLYHLEQGTDASLTYSTAETAGSIPKLESTYLLSVWWTPDAVRAVEDPDVEWKLTKWANPSDHDHCWLCSRKIGEWSDPPLWEGYTAAGQGRWLCPDCFRTYIEHGPPWARR